MEPTGKITRSINSQQAENNWLIVDAEGKTLGRFASQVAALIRGKHKPSFTPHVDCGDYVIVVNADKIKISEKRFGQKEYFRHSGYPGGVTMEKFKDLIQTKPERIIQNAVKGMLPKNRLGKELNKKLRVYAGTEHPHEAQQPTQYDIK